MRTRRIAFVSVLAACAVAIPAAPAMAGGDVTVMTRNIYLGADIIQLALPSTEAEFKTAASGMWKTVQATNFPKRAPALAKEIKSAKPDLVGLQEATVWRTGPAGGNATKVKYDFIKELLSALKKQKMEYTLVVKQQEFDFQGPTNSEQVRITMYDAILKRKKGSKVKVGKGTSANYNEKLVVPTAVGPANVNRGWTAVDASIGGTDFKFVNTHLEAYGAAIRAAQATELISAGGPLADGNQSAILLGDLNSGPTSPAPDGYPVLAGAGFTSVWGDKTDVRTFGRNELLTAQDSGGEFIDHILFRPSANFSVKSKKVIGNSAFQKKAPKWSSDHNGVVAKLSLK